MTSGCGSSSPRPILFVANANIPSLQLSFLAPLGLSPEDGSCELLTEQDLNAALKKAAKGPAGAAWFRARLDAARPDLVVLCRYSGPHSSAVVSWARENGVPTVYHLDDDLLSVPIELGAAKHAMHNHPDRLASVRYLLDNATLVYCSTTPLRQRLFGEDPPERAVAGDVYCTQPIREAPPAPGARQVVGYMGFDHAHDFTLALPALIRLLDSRPDLPFEMFGSIPVPDELKRFGDRVRTIEPVRDYAGFTEKLASLRWTIGICPLAKTPFNEVKADTKWVEYTACGFAVVASRDTVYDRCCADGCGLLVEGEDEWLAAFEQLLDDEEGRIAQVERAQDRLRRDYSPERLREQIGAVFEKARSLAGGGDGHAGGPDARPTPSTVITFDEMRGDRLVAWAFDPTELDTPAAEQKPIELWCGKTRIGALPRTVKRPDVDAYVGDSAAAPKGVSIPCGGLLALWRLLGESAEFEPSLRLGDASVPFASAGPAFRDTAFLRTLQNARRPRGWNVVDLWWATPRLLKIRTAGPEGEPPAPTFTELRVLQPMRTERGGLQLVLVDEQPVRPGAGIVMIGVQNAFMPIVLVGRDATGGVVFVDVLPFPSLLRGGMHEHEVSAMGAEGGTLGDACRLNDAYLAELAGWGEAAQAPTIARIAFDMRSATGAERILDPMVRRWLASVFGLPVVGVGQEERREADLGDDSFVDFAQSLLVDIPVDRPRAGRATLSLSGDAIPTIGALVSRRAAVPTALRPGCALIADEAFPNRRWIVAPPREANRLDIVGAGLATMPHLALADDVPEIDDDADDDGLTPLAIVFRDLSPQRDLRLLFPVPKDAPAIPLPEPSAAEPSVAVLMTLPRPDIDVTSLLASVASQRVAGGCQILVGASNQHPALFGDLTKILEEACPGGARAIPLEGASRASEIVNLLAMEADADALVVLDPAIILHDERTLETLARLACLPDAGTVGCMLLRPDPKAPAGSVFRSAGLFPGRVDYTVAPHVALAEPDCSRLLPAAVYPVAANSRVCWAVATSVWREAGGLATATFPNADAEIDLAFRLAARGRLNLCTTKVSVLVDEQRGASPTRDLGAPAHLGLRRVLPALQSSTVLRSF